MNAAFAMWRDRDIDGLEYERQIGAEWDERDAAIDERLARSR